MESVTDEAGLYERIRIGAQRLPASWNRSPSFLLVAMIVPTMCSTPSGIMESVTVERKTHSDLLGSAQRLPASWNRSPKSACCSPAICCSAQRLPASWNRSLAPGAQRLQVVQRCSTPSGIMESVTTAPWATKVRLTSAQRLPASWNRSPGQNS